MLWHLPGLAALGGLGKISAGAAPKSGLEVDDKAPLVVGLLTRTEN